MYIVWLKFSLTRKSLKLSQMGDMATCSLEDISTKPDWYRVSASVFVEEIEKIRGGFQPQQIDEIMRIFLHSINEAEKFQQVSENPVLIKKEVDDEEYQVDASQLVSVDMGPEMSASESNVVKTAKTKKNFQRDDDGAWYPGMPRSRKSKNPVKKKIKTEPNGETETANTEDSQASSSSAAKKKGGVPRPCPHCGKEYFSRGSLMRHITFKHKESVKCPKCNLTIPATQLEKHLSEHDGAPTPQCSECGETFKTRTHLNNHVFRKHKPENWVVCVVCGKSIYKYVLHKHMECHNIAFDETGAEKKLFPCDQCDQSYATSTRLYTHVKTVHKTSSLVCTVCGKGFRFKGKLREHEAQHTGEPLFKCTICHEGFFQRRQYSHHIRIHNNDRRYPCPQCPKAFFKSERLKEHMHTHTGARPYICPICGLSYTAGGSMYTHIRIKHKDNKSIAGQHVALGQPIQAKTPSDDKELLFGGSQEGNDSPPRADFSV